MKTTSISFADANQRLAESCRACSARCCKKGLLLLLPHELASIEGWLQEHAPENIGPFRDRIHYYDDFALFDQQLSCLFLDDNDLCVLHSAGLKPTECFIWPLHIYLGHRAETVDVRVSTSCCDGYQNITDTHPSVYEAIKYARAVGYNRLTYVRSAYPGSYQTRLILTVFD